MADNTILDPGAGGDTIATDDIAGVKHQLVKVEYGAADSATQVSTANPLPVDSELTTVDADTGAGTDTRAGIVLVRAESGGGVLVGSGNPLPVSGTITANAGSGTLNTSDQNTLVDNDAFTDGTSRVFPVGLIFDDVAGTALTENDVAAARINANRATVSTIEDGATRARYATVTASNALKIDGSAVTQPVSGTVTANAGTGTFTTAESQVITDNAAFTDGTSKLFMAGYILDDTAGTALTENDAAAPRISTNRAVVGVIEDGATRARYATVTASNALKVDGSAVTQPVSITSGQNVGIVPRTSGGLTTFHLVSAATTNATNIKASAGQVFGWKISNRHATNWGKVVFHNTAGTPTAGASVFATVDVPPASGANVFSDIGIAFGTGIAITTVTGAADSDTTAVGANDLNINIYYA